MQTIKCVVVGDDKADKVGLLTSYSNTTGRYPAEYKPVFDNYAVTVMLNGKPYTLVLFDTTGKNEVDRLRPLDYHETDVFVVCFSVVHPASFENVRVKWVPELKKYNPNTSMVLVGTKLEMRDDKAIIKELQERGLKAVTYVEGLQLQREIGAVKYHECSTKTLEGIKEVFDDAIRAAVMPFIFTGKANPVLWQTRTTL